MNEPIFQYTVDENGRKDAYGWIATAYGAIDLLNPSADQVDIRDIISALPHVNRFGGQTFIPYSVAAHSLALYQYGRFELGIEDPGELAWALLHDAAEAYLGDLPSPIKKIMPSFCELEDKLLAVIAEKFQLPAEMPKWLKVADKQIVHIEADKLFRVKPDWTQEIETPGLAVYGYDINVIRYIFKLRLKEVLPDEEYEG